MSGGSSNAVEWFTQLEPSRERRAESGERRAESQKRTESQSGPVLDSPLCDDPRLDEIIQPWTGDPAALRLGRAVIVGFPVDDGVRRNHGRIGSAAAPDEIRRWLGRLTAWDGQNDIDLSKNPPLDAGNVRKQANLENAQAVLGEIIAGLLAHGAVPIVLGGGHETAYGHFLGYAALGRLVGIINLDAHLDVRPCLDGRGHSGSPFRQAMEHPTHPLEPGRYVCLGAQPASVSRAHKLYVQEQKGVIRWCEEVRGSLGQHVAAECDRLAAAGCDVYLTIDADVVRAADVPGVSAPNPLGLAGEEIAACARLAGESAAVRSLDLVEINPRHDRDGQSARWAAAVVWNFLAGLARR